jgi:hypothetical protein
MFSKPWRTLTLLAAFCGATAACTAAPAPTTESYPDDPSATGGKGGSPGPAATGGSRAGGSGGSVTGTGGSLPGTGGSVTGTGGSSSGAGGSVTGTGGSESGAGGSPSDPPDAAAPAPDGSGPPAPGGGSFPSPPFDVNAFGGVGETPYVPLQYTAPVGPPVAMECQEDPTAGHTEYRGYFKVQRPSDLKAGDRFEYKDGIYTFWVSSNDKSHTTTSGTEPRTEARYPSYASGEHIWSADMMYEHVDKTCVFQIHNEVGNYATYLRITGDMMFDLKTRKTVTTGMANKWFNMKVLFNTQTLDVKIYINNCLKFSAKSPEGPTPNWYFKHGTYTCDSGTCKSHYKNIHLYQLGSKDPLGMPPAGTVD